MKLNRIKEIEAAAKQAFEKEFKPVQTQGGAGEEGSGH